jgi:hypothetical protein
LSQKRAQTVARHKKPVSPLLASLSKRVTVSANAAREMALKPYIALDLMAQGRCSEELFDLLTHYTVFVELLCNRGVLAAEAHLAREAQKNLLRCGNQHRASGRWVFDEDMRASAAGCLDLYWRQLQQVSRTELLVVTEELQRLLAVTAAGWESTSLAA